MTLTCEQCGGSLEVSQHNLLVKCPYCGVALTYDKSGFIGRFILKRIIAYPMAARIFETRLAHARVRDLLEKPDPELFYFPFWRITTKLKDDEEVRFTLGADPEDPIISRARLPEGELMEYRSGSEYDAPIREATVTADEALGRLTARGEAFDTVKELALILAPFYLFGIKTKEGKRHALLLEASSGRLYDDLPKRSGALALSQTGLPFLIVLFLFLLEGLLIRNPIAKLIVFCLTMVPAYLVLSVLRDRGQE